MDVEKVFDWKIKDFEVIFYDDEGNEVGRKNIFDVIRAFLWVESNKDW